MRGGRVEVKVRLLYILPVISFRTRESEQPLLENGVPAIPQGERETQSTLTIGDAEQPILFTPAIRPAARVVMGEVLPAVSIFRVILPDRTPLPLREVRPPPLPVAVAPRILCQALGFCSSHGTPPDGGRGLHSCPNR